MTAESLNIELFNWIHSGAGTHPVIDNFAIFFSETGPYLLLIIFAVLWFRVDIKRKTALAQATAAAVIALILNQLIGLFYFHPRPFMIGLCEPLFPHGPETSFPSDHASLLFTAAFYLLLVKHWTSCGMTLLAIAVLTAWGRVYSGIHFPFDMAGSMVVGLLSTGFMHFIKAWLSPIDEIFIQKAELTAGRWLKIKKHPIHKK